MRLSTTVNLCLGIILFILLLISTVALYQTHNATLSLNTVLGEHVPVLRILIKNEELLGEADLMFEEHYNSDKISPSEIFSLLHQLKRSTQQAKSEDKNNNNYVAETERLLESIEVLVRQFPSPEDNSLAGVARALAFQWSGIHSRIMAAPFL